MKEYEVDRRKHDETYLSKEEFYQIAHISKRTALWLLETGLVVAEKPAKKGLGYRIPKMEVEKYLADRVINPMRYQTTSRCRKFPHSPQEAYTKELGEKIRHIVELEIQYLPEILTTEQLSGYMEYRLRDIYTWHKTLGLKVLDISGGFVVPKLYFLDFTASEAFYTVKNKTGKHISLIRRAIYE